MVWTKLPRSLAHRALKSAESAAVFRDRFYRAQYAEVLRAEKRAEAAQLELRAAHEEHRRSFLAACIALDKLETAREQLAASADCEGES